MLEIEPTARRILTVITVFTVLTLVVGNFLGTPILLSYVETGSMSPTLDAGDGFVAVPAALGGSIEEGDVVVFRAEELRGGGLTTHRIVGKTDHGYLTKGDANTFTDQDDDEPPVKRAQIVAEALQVNGNVVSIPHLGTAVHGVQTAVVGVQRRMAGLLGIRSLLGGQGLAYLFFAATIVWYIVGTWHTSSSQRTYERGRSRDSGVDARFVVASVAAVLVLSATAAMVVPAGSQEYGIVSADFESEKPTVVPAGQTRETAYPVRNSGVLPVLVHLEPASEGVEIRPRELVVSGRHRGEATLKIHAPAETGYYRRYVTEHRYLAVLPVPLIRELYGIHPWAPILVIDAVIAIPTYLFGVSVLGSQRLRDRTRKGKYSATNSARQFFRGRY
ncbi:signal peptidase I [Haloarculaceae archaeon H-GB11]|nr:signal peptidase I [Haloarculaceae archaeon H-GB11]